MKILQVCNFLAPERGGAAEVPFQLSKALAKRGHHVTVFTSGRGKFPTDSTADGMEIRAFKSQCEFAGFDFTPGIIKASRQELKGYDVIHLHNYRTFQNNIVHHYANKYGTPYVLQAHGSLVTYYQKSFLKKIYDSGWGRQILKDAAKALAVSAIEVVQYKSLGVSEGNIQLMPNGIDLDAYTNLPDREVFRDKYNLADNPVVLYLGRIHKSKNLDSLAKAFAGLQRNIPDARLVIAGPDDGYVSTLKGLLRGLNIEEKALFTGSLYGRQKLEAYTAADLFVNPRADEIFGLVFLEALACGTPVICSKGCGIAGLIDKQVGLASITDENALAEAMRKILGDKALRQQYSEAGKLLVKDFDWANIAGQAERLYQTLI
jgi:glycosyltransferase involved in cell wall biosynthesis